MTTPSDLLLVRELARINFLYFLQLAFEHLHGGRLLKGNWHHEAITFELELVRRGFNKRLIVNLPPRALKSEMVSICWVAWMLGLDPRLKFFCVSYSDELASDFGRQCMSLIESGWYRDLFPKTILGKRSQTNFTTTMGGGRLAGSIDGTLTGRGGDFVIIDDPGKADEALSEAMRAKVIRWYNSTLHTRLDDKMVGSIILVMQRLHEDDLTGYLLRTWPWRHLSLPAIAEESAEIPLLFGQVHHRKVGEVLHHEHMPITALDEAKAIMGAMLFEAQFQQNPVPASGNYAKASWLRVYDQDQRVPQGMIIQSWDTASKEGLENDWSVCVTACVVGKLVYIIDVYRARLDIVDLAQEAKRLAQRFRPQVLLIEDAASGMQLIQILSRDQTPSLPRPIPRKPEKDKKTRFNAACVMIEAGQLLLPNHASWLSEFRAEILGFPNRRFNDQADALAQMLIWLRNRREDPPSAHGFEVIEEEVHWAEDQYHDDEDLDDPDEFFEAPY